MAAGTLPSPGKRIQDGPNKGLEIGPCVKPCQHTDCAATRRMAEAPCRICGRAIGYETRYYDERPRLVHAVCAETEAERAE